MFFRLEDSHIHAGVDRLFEWLEAGLILAAGEDRGVEERGEKGEKAPRPKLGVRSFCGGKRKKRRVCSGGATGGSSGRAEIQQRGRRGAVQDTKLDTVEEAHG